MDRTRMRTGIVCLLLATTLALGGCNTFVSERCSGSNYERDCTVSIGSSDGQWSTQLEGGPGHTTMVLTGTFAIESGSGTLSIYGRDEGMEYLLSPDEPVVIENLTLSLSERAGAGDEGLATMRTDAEGTFEGFSAEYSFVTR